MNARAKQIRAISGGSAHLHRGMGIVGVDKDAGEEEEEEAVNSFDEDSNKRRKPGLLYKSCHYNMDGWRRDGANSLTL